MKIINEKKIIKNLTIFLIILCIILNFEIILNHLNNPELKIYDLSYLIVKESNLKNENSNNLEILISKKNNQQTNYKYLILKIFIFSFLFIFIGIITYLIKKINSDNIEYNKKINNIFIHKNGETDELILIQNIK